MAARQIFRTSEGADITATNKRLKSAHDSVLKADPHLSQALGRLDSHPGNIGFIQELRKAEKRKETAGSSYTKALALSMAAKGKGSGRVGLLLPTEVARDMYKQGAVCAEYSQ